MSPVRLLSALFLLLCAGGLGATDARVRHIVEFESAPLVRHLHELRAKASDASAPDAGRLDLDQPRAREWLLRIDADQAGRLRAAASLLGREPGVRHRYRLLLNGVALDLSEAEAEALGRLEGVRAVQRADAEWREPQSDAGPAWVGAEAVWQGLGGLPPTRGEGVVVGIIDSGINEQHPSFAATDSDGYAHVNPRGRFFGQCQQAPSRCNAKLIGIHDFTDEGDRLGRDLDGHGSHVAATAVGNVLDASIQGQTVTVPLRLSGVAPRASLISYKACTQEPRACPLDALFAALEQAVADGVDVINYSIGGLARDAWRGLRPGEAKTDSALMLAARDAGITVVAAAGNGGPGAGSLSAPANAPWVLAVANASHDRRFQNAVRDLRGGAGPPPPDLLGVGVSAGTQERPIVYAGDFGFPLCSQGEDIDFPPSGASNPWPPGTFSGQIVVCDRGVTARVAKGFNLAQAGAGGMILVNMPADGESVVSDDHFLPATHIGAADGARLKAWLASGSGHRGRLEGLVADRDPQRADVLSASSARGPAVPQDGFLKPDLAAPGSSIVAASHQGSGLATLGGTSMAAPHVAGAAALLRALHPGWTPSMLESALLTRLRPVGRLQDGVRPAGALARGGGMLDVGGARQAGLAFPVSRAQYLGADPQAGGDPRTLNRPSLYSQRCFQTCSFTRSVQSLLDHPREWLVEAVDLAPASVTVDPPAFTLAAGATRSLQITLDVRDPSLPGRWVEGRLRLRPAVPGAGVAATEIPIAVFADPGNLPAAIEVSNAADQGTLDLTLSGLVALPSARFQPSPLVRGDQRVRTLPRHEAASQPFNGAAGTWSEALLLQPPGPQGGRVRFAAQVASPSNQLHLYLGVGSGGAPSQLETLCSALGAGGSKRCHAEVEFAPGEGPKHGWVLVQNVFPSSAGGDRVDLEFHGVPLVEGGTALAAFGPGSAAAGQSFPLRLAWSEARMRPGEVWHGYLSLGTGPGNPGPAARVPVRIVRGAAPPAVRPLPPAGGVLRVGLPGGGRHEGAFIDVPAGVTRLVLESLGSGQVELHAMRRDPPGEGSGPAIAPPPPTSEAVASDTGTSGPVRRIELAGSALVPGRWYLTPVNRSGAPVEVDLRATLETTGVAPATPDGAWFNPARDGHGFFLSRGSGQWVLLWYSFDHLDLPQWFLAQAPAPASQARAWEAPLFRFAWDGSASSGLQAGRVILTRTADRRVQFSWELDGFSGSEPMRFIDPGPCPQRDGQAFDPSGLWYPPAAPGSGFNLVASSTVEVAVLYLFDAAGLPRWLYASADGFGSGPLPVFQIRGFCRHCAHAPRQLQPAGQVAIDYAGIASAGFVVEAAFQPPLAGVWQRAQAVATLSDPLTCP
jgi:subtilisin family serine protease